MWVIIATESFGTKNKVGYMKLGRERIMKVSIKYYMECIVKFRNFGYENLEKELINPFAILIKKTY